MKVFLQVQAAIPPGYRVQFGEPEPDDRPRLPDGSVPERRLSSNGSLASPHIREYTHALIRDLCRQYPEIHGIRVDCPEYPPYLLDSIFLDFGRHARREAAVLGFDFDRIRRAAAKLYRRLHGGLHNSDLTACTEASSPGQALRRLASDSASLVEWVQFKARMVESLHAGFRKTMDQAGAGHIELWSNAFPPPWNTLSGMDYGLVGRYGTAISVKLYTMHWPMMLRFYGDQLRQANPGLSGSLLARALVLLFDISDDPAPVRLEGLCYPSPQEPHPAGAAAQHRKIV